MLDQIDAHVEIVVVDRGLDNRPTVTAIFRLLTYEPDPVAQPAGGDGGVFNEAAYAATIGLGAASVEIEPPLFIEEGGDVVSGEGVAMRMARFAGQF